MELMKMDLGQIILNIGSIVGLFSFIYSINQIIGKRPRFKFKESGMSGTVFEKDGVEWYKLEISGIIKNQSLHANSINVIHTVVWENRKKHISLRHSTGVDIINSITDDRELRLPILLNGHEAKKIIVISTFPIRGTCDESILTQREEIGGGLTIPKYSYKLLFEDTNENIFDGHGHLCNMEESGLRRTIGNTVHSLKNGESGEFIRHYFLIWKSQLKFTLKKILYYLGIAK